MRTCYLRVCARPAKHRGLCAAHYKRKQRKTPLDTSVEPSYFKSRFFEKFEAGSPEECWEWVGALDKGYGRIKKASKTELAHRTAYRVFVGKIPEGLYVCHHCDNRRCVNPHHLFLGTQKDNMKDAWNKGRLDPPDLTEYQFKEGNKPTNRNLSDEEVKEIVGLLSLNRLTQKEIAKRFNVPRQTVADISCGRTYTNVSRG